MMEDYLQAVIPGRMVMVKLKLKFYRWDTELIVSCTYLQLKLKKHPVKTIPRTGSF